MPEAALSFLVLLALAAAFASLRGIPGGAAPLLSVSAVMLWLGLTVTFGLLPFGGWALVLFAAGGFGLALWRARARMLRAICAPGFLLFVFLGLVLLCWMPILRPAFHQWDEFSFWGFAGKLTVVSDTSYATADTGFFATYTEPPGLIVLSWFVHLFSSDFHPWMMYFAYGLLLLACAAAVISPYDAKQWRIWVPLSVCTLLTPFFFWVAYHTIDLASPYLSVYADIPAGMLFGAVLTLYFGQRLGPSKYTPWAALLPLGALSLVKFNVLPAALLSAAIMAADSVLFDSKAVKTRLVFAGACFAAVAAAYLPWQRHAALAAAQNRHPLVAATAGQTNIPVLQAAGIALRQLTGLAPQTEVMTRVLNESRQNFFGAAKAGDVFAPGLFKVSMAGSPFATVLFIAAISILAILCMQGRRRKKRAAAAAALMLAGFAAWHFMLLVFWAVLSKNTDAGVIDYARYLATFNIGWMLLALTTLGAAYYRQDTAPPVLPARLRQTRLRRQAAAVLALALAVFMTAHFAALVRPGYSILDAPSSAFSTRHRLEAGAKAIAATVPDGEKIFFVRQAAAGENGGWDVYHLLFWPAVLDFSITGGAPFDPYGEYGVPLDTLTAYLKENGLHYIFIENADEIFAEGYGSIFAGGLKDLPGTPTLYRLEAGGLYAPVDGVKPAARTKE